MQLATTSITHETNQLIFGRTSNQISNVPVTSMKHMHTHKKYFFSNMVEKYRQVSVMLKPKFCPWQ